MSRQSHTDNPQDTFSESDEWMQEDDLDSGLNDAKIYQKDGINPAKRRRLEAMREERELLKDLKDVFDEWDD